jgi:glycosidase
LNQKRTYLVIEVIYEKDSKYPINSLSMCFLENHDEKRSLEIFGPEGIEAYATFLFSLPGIPLIYAGQELGEVAVPSLFEKISLKWIEKDEALFKMYQRLIAFRKTYDCLAEGSLVPIQAAVFSGSIAAFMREGKKSVALIVCNLINKPAEKVLITIPDSIKNRLKGVKFRNILEEDIEIDLNKIYFDNFLPFVTQIYVAEKQAI